MMNAVRSEMPAVRYLTLLDYWFLGSTFGVLIVIITSAVSASCLLPSASYLLPPTFCLLPPASYLLPPYLPPASYLLPPTSCLLHFASYLLPPTF